MTDVDIRPATPADRDAIAAMAREVVSAGRMFAYEDVQGVLAYWFSAGASIFVARLGGAVCGTYVVKANQPGRGAHVANAGYMVAEAFRGRGVGRAMGEHSLDTARSLGFEAMQFNMVVAENEGAVRLWEGLGFRIVGTLPQVFRVPGGRRVDAYVMHRQLS